MSYDEQDAASKSVDEEREKLKLLIEINGLLNDDDVELMKR